MTTLDDFSEQEKRLWENPPHGFNIGKEAHLTFVRPTCSLCHVLIKIDAEICPYCGATIVR